MLHLTFRRQYCLADYTNGQRTNDERKSISNSSRKFISHFPPTSLMSFPIIVLREIFVNITFITKMKYRSLFSFIRVISFLQANGDCIRKISYRHSTNILFTVLFLLQFLILIKILQYLEWFEVLKTKIRFVSVQ